jgi:hypothetical protein
MGRWLRWVVPAVAVALGFVLAAAGLVYDLAFAGLPYQDPTPEMQARWRYHSGVASVIELVGGGGCAARRGRTGSRRRLVADNKARRTRRCT